jgi:hypothetical protein
MLTDAAANAISAKAATTRALPATLPISTQDRRKSFGLLSPSDLP